MSGFVPFLAYEASAGSGKTFNLVVRYLSLLFMGEEPQSIVALTFTNKAANEMMERVVETLKHLESRGELAQISRVSGLNEAEILGKREGVLKRFLRSDVKIATIDKFFGTILRKFALNAGIMPTFATTQNHHEVKLMERFLHEIEVNGQSDALVSLSLVSAKRLSDLFELLSQLYSKHKEFDSLIFEPMDQSINARAIAMGHALELARLCLGKELSPRARKTMEFTDYETLLQKTWLFKPSMEYWDFKKGYEPKMDELLTQIQSAVLLEMRQRESIFFKELFSVLGSYIKSRTSLGRETNELSFDDITLMVHTLLRGKLESEFLYFRLDGRMKHLLLDEFQDTSIIQFDILRPLIEEIRAGKGVNEGGSFFFVGDVKQSIYRFRGGVSALFYQVADHFNVHVEPLRVNYRSRTQIVQFVNRVFEEKIKGYVLQEALDPKNGGYVEVAFADNPLERLGEGVCQLKEKGIPLEEIAVLTATNSDGSAVEEHLTQLGYEVVTETTARLTSQRTVRAMIEYLRYCYFNAPIYAHNCAALLGVDVTDIPNEKITDLLTQSTAFVRKWEIGDKSMLMFLEILNRYRDIEEVVFEIDRLETNAPQSDLQGIRVMTVHKSKGLEFEHVFVLDRLGQARKRGGMIVYEYDRASLSKVFYRIKGREELDTAYATALAKEKELENEDQLNALYVALTRAVKSLNVIAKQKGSWFEPLRLEEGKWGEIECESHKGQPVATYEPLQYTPQSYGRQEENTAQPKEEAYDYEAVQFGNALHYTLEMMGSFKQDSLSIALESTRNRFGAMIGESGIDEIGKRVGRLLEDEQFIALSGGKYYKEQTIRYKGAVKVIDLLIRHENHWVIIDYKSGTEEREKHQEQVRTYIEAVRALSGDEVSGYLCYLLEEKTEWGKCL